MKKDNTSIFSFFRRKKRKLTEKQQNELALEQARAMSDRMAKDKEDIRDLFLQKLLENAKQYNEAKESIDSIEVEKKEEN